MEEEKSGHFTKLPLDTIRENVDAEPKEPYTEAEIVSVLHDLRIAVDNKSYIPQTATAENPALSDDYIFDTDDENLVLKDLTQLNFVAKIKDVGKGAKRRMQQGYPQEYLYVFKYPCKLQRRDAQESNTDSENVLIYIKINNRKIPDKKLFIISFHKNRPKHN